MSCFPYHNQNNNDYNSNKDPTNQATRYSHSSAGVPNSNHGNRMLSDGYQRFPIRGFASGADHHHQQQQQQQYLMDCNTCDRSNVYCTGDQPNIKQHQHQPQLQQQWQQGSSTSITSIASPSSSLQSHGNVANHSLSDRHVYQNIPSWPGSTPDASNVQYQRDALAVTIARQVHASGYLDAPMQRHFQAPMTGTTANVPSGQQRIKSASCMFGSNRTFDHNSYMHELNQEQWLQDYTQDPTMRSRPCFTTHQTRELEREFTLCQYITRRRRIEMAYTLSLTEKQIKTWFQNRRVKERKMKKSESD